MATQDISRFLLQPNKHYSTLHMQQGRVIVDSDWNERAGIDAEELRQTVLDMVCSRGTPNKGFGVTLAAAPGVEVPVPGEAVDYPTYDFQIGGGSYYIGGLRFAVDGSEQFLTQSDWLQVNSLIANLPAQVVVDVEEDNSRTDLVYVYAWEQPVTAVEDSELREVALGGRDTSVRIKRMRRFVVATGVSNDCAVAFESVVTSLEGAGQAVYNPDTGELVSEARLSVISDDQAAAEDPCADPTQGGYVGAENQTIRVELRSGNKLVWGFDNASKLYRVQVEGTSVSFLTTPEDLASMPRAGQVVEILQWGAKLPNDEKVAEAQGFVTSVATSYDPISKALELALAVDPYWNTWLDNNGEHQNPNDPDGAKKYLYLRVWDRGSELVSAQAPAEIGYVLDPYTEIPLGKTGLKVAVTADGKPGDYWIVAARPSTPNVVTPWDLSDSGGVAPHGPRRFYAPLGLIDWTENDVTVTHEVKECRTPLRQLCQAGPCTITVGDGKQSFGQVSTLADAIAIAKDGDKICVLPGRHEGVAEIKGFDGLLIEGCGIRSILQNGQPTEENPNFTVFGPSVIKIEDSVNVTIKDLGVLGTSAVGIEVLEQVGVCKKIKLDGVFFLSTGGYSTNASGTAINFWLPTSAITVAAASEVEIVRCVVSMDRVLNFSYAVVLGGDSIRMRDCVVEASGNDGNVSLALGGVNVRSGSRDVEIIGCEINGGWGHGIALGHGRVYQEDETPSRKDVLREKVTIGDAETSGSGDGDGDPTGCHCEQDSGATTTATFDALVKFFPAGAVEDVRIHDNHIHNMGISGIATAMFWPTDIDFGAGLGVPRFIVVTDIDIARNVIEDNVTRALTPSTFTTFVRAVGGVCLTASVNAWIHENTIRNNGTQYLMNPICGVGLVAAMNAVIEDNQIVGNGWRLAAGSETMLQPGLRGGIAIWEATKVRTKAKTQVAGEAMPTFPTGTATEVPVEGVKDWTGASSQSAVTVRGNEVSQPLGRALWISRAFGPIVVTGNSLESFGSPVNGDSVPGASLSWMYTDAHADTQGALLYDAAGACVEVSNYALPEDKPWSPDPSEYPEIQFVDPGQDQVEGGSVLVSGNRMRLEWDRKGGWAASVLVQSIGAVVFNNNVAEVVTGNEFSPEMPSPEEDWDFATRVCAQAPAHAFLMTNVFVGGRSSASLVGNRMVEPRWDAVFSAIVGPPALGLHGQLVAPVTASLATSNVGSHCVIAAATGGAAVKANNLEIYGLERVAVGTGTVVYTCDDASLVTNGVVGESRLIVVSISVAAS